MIAPKKYGRNVFLFKSPTKSLNFLQAENKRANKLKETAN